MRFSDEQQGTTAGFTRNVRNRGRLESSVRTDGSVAATRPCGLFYCTNPAVRSFRSWGMMSWLARTALCSASKTGEMPASSLVQA